MRARPTPRAWARSERPLELCPSCLQKLTWNVGLDPLKRFEDLAAFSADAGLSENLALVRQSLEVLRRPPPPALR